MQKDTAPDGQMSGTTLHPATRRADVTFADSYRVSRYVDPDDSRPVIESDLLSRRPLDPEPRSAVCSCGAPILKVWADDPAGPAGSHFTEVDAEPSGAGKWFMAADGSISWDPSHGTYRLHDCSRPVACVADLSPSARRTVDAIGRGTYRDEVAS